MRNVLHILVSGKIGGIEKMIYNYSVRSTINNYYCFLIPNGIFYEKIDQDKVIHFKNAKSFFKTKKELFAFIKNKNIDVVVTHHASPYSWLLAYFAKKALNVRFVLYCHGALNDMLRNKFKNKLIFSFIKSSVFRFVTISDFVTKTILLSGISQTKIYRIYNGVCLNNQVMASNNNEILFIGRLVKEKGVRYLIYALNILNKKNVVFHCTIVGDGNEKEELISIAKMYGLSNKISFFESVCKVEEFYTKANIFVHPSIWNEGFGISVVEAMSSGLICICSNSGALPEIIQHNINGMLFEKQNYMQLANLILKTFELNEFERGFIRNNAVESSKKYDISIYTENFDKFLNNLGEEYEKN